MKILLVVLFLIFLVATYDKWSMNAYYKRCEINAKHPDWYPRCGINFFEKDPQWFIDNGYEEYVR